MVFVAPNKALVNQCAAQVGATWRQPPAEQLTWGSAGFHKAAATHSGAEEL